MKSKSYWQETNPMGENGENEPKRTIESMNDEPQPDFTPMNPYMMISKRFEEDLCCGDYVAAIPFERGSIVKVLAEGNGLVFVEYWGSRYALTKEKAQSHLVPVSEERSS